MAFVVNNTGNEEDNTTSSTPLDQGTTTQTTQPSESEDSTPTPSPQVLDSQNQGDVPTVNKKSPKASSGMFTNIQRYVEKNKPQAQKMAQGVSTDVTKQAQDIRDVATKKQEDLQSKLDINKGLRDDARTFADKEVESIVNPTDTTVPTNYPSEDAISRYKQIASGNVSGTMNVGDIDLNEQINKAQALKNLTGRFGTEEGRRNLLQGTFGKDKQYTRGMSSLDQLILSGDEDAVQQLTDTSKIGQGLIGGIKDDPTTEIDETQVGLTGMQDLARAKLGIAGKETSDLTDYTNSLLYGDTGAISGIEDATQTQHDLLQKQYDALISELGSSFGVQGDYDLSQDALDALGLTAGTNLYGIDPSQYVNELMTDPTFAEAMTSDQVSKLAALSKLSGKDSKFGMITPEEAAAMYDPSQLLDDKFQSDLTKAKTDWEAQKLPLKLEAQKFGNQEKTLMKQLEDMKKKRGYMNYTGSEWTEYGKQKSAELISQLNEVTANKNNIMNQIYGSPNRGGADDADFLNASLGFGGKSDLIFGKKYVDDNEIAELLRQQALFKKLKLQE